MSTFYTRALILIVLLTVVALGEIAFRGKSATRWREYLMLLGFAFMGVLYGLLNDACTAHISPDYFAVGKGLGYDNDLYARAVHLGGQAGFAAGAVLGAFYLFARTFGPWPPLGFRRVAVYALIPLVVAPICAIVVGMYFRTLPAGDLIYVFPELTVYEIQDFLAVQGAHWGAYVGGAGGTLFGVLRVLAARFDLRRSDSEQ